MKTIDKTSRFRDQTLSIDERARDLAAQLTLEEKVGQMVHDASGVERLGIPAYNWWSECLHGVARAGRATIFPQAIGMAATFDPELLERVASAISDEARAKHHLAAASGNHGRYSGLTFWAPNINIFRDPRWGRGQETFGEDPFLTGKLGTAFVRGLQGNHPKYLKIAACAKHFAVHSGPEGERHSFNAIASTRDLWDTYLPAFKELVEAGVEVVMGAYNRINGEPCCGSKFLLEKILREGWKFNGHVVSDCWAIRDLHEHHRVTKTSQESAALALEAGCDLNCGCTYPHLVGAVENGLITEADIDRSFVRLAKTWLKLGMFDDPEQVPYTRIPITVVNCEVHQRLAREAAAKSCVLLKNDGNLLPLPKKARAYYVTGPNAASVDVLMGNYYGAGSKLTTILEGITAAVDVGTYIEYRQGSQVAVENVNPTDWVSFEASMTDATIAVMGSSPLIEGEEGDAIASADLGDRLDIAMPANQLRALRKLRKAGNKIVLVLTGGSPIAMREAMEIADSVLWVWYPGEAGGEGVADILFGDTSPSGRLPITFPKSTDQLPPYEDYGMQGRTYRYMEEEPLLPFGFGLSYTTFRYDKITMQADRVGVNGKTVARVHLTNIGQRRGDEIVQLYLRWLDFAESPLQALRSFQRISLDPGESKAVDFQLGPKELALADENGNISTRPGRIEVIAAGACPIPRSEALGAARAVSTVLTIV